MGNIKTLGGNDLPNESPVSETQAVYIYADRRIMFKQQGVEELGPMLRDAGIEINSIATVEDFEQALASARHRLAESAYETMAERAKAGENSEMWQALSMILGGGDLDEARDLIKQGERKENISLVDPTDDGEE